VTSVTFSPDGSTALSGSADQTLILWDVSSGQPLRTFTGHSIGVTSVAFSPDGKTALSGSYDTTLIWWDVSSAQPLRTFTGHSNIVTSVALSPDGKTALSGSADQTLMLWRIDSLDGLIQWIYANRVVPELTCSQRHIYNVQPLCDAQGVYPTRTPARTWTPSRSASPTPTANLTLTTATPVPMTAIPVLPTEVTAEAAATGEATEASTTEATGEATEAIEVAMSEATADTSTAARIVVFSIVPDKSEVRFIPCHRLNRYPTPQQRIILQALEQLQRDATFVGNIARRGEKDTQM
jgi:hypothetical protein